MVDRDDRRTARGLMAAWTLFAITLACSIITAAATAGLAVRVFEWVS